MELEGEDEGPVQKGGDESQDDEEHEKEDYSKSDRDLVPHELGGLGEEALVLVDDLVSVLKVFFNLKTYTKSLDSAVARLA